jgi:hypothetical protein
LLIIVPRTCSLQTSARIDQQQKFIVFASYAFLRMKQKKQKFRLRSHQKRNTLILSFIVLHLDPDSSFSLCSPNAIHNQVLVIQKSGNQKIRSSSLHNEHSNFFFSVSPPPQFRRYFYHSQSPLARTSLTSLSLVHTNYPVSLSLFRFHQKKIAQTKSLRVVAFIFSQFLQELRSLSSSSSSSSSPSPPLLRTPSLARYALLASPVWQPSGASKDSGRTIPTIICMEGRIYLRTVGHWTDSMPECLSWISREIQARIKLGTSWGTNFGQVLH